MHLSKMTLKKVMYQRLLKKLPENISSEKIKKGRLIQYWKILAHTGMMIQKNKINAQFDVVARNREGYLFYEVKFTSKPLTDSLIKEEVEQVNSTSLKAVKYGFISRSGFDLKEEYPHEFLGLTDIYY